MSTKPGHLSGRGRNPLASRENSSTRKLSSPRLVVITSPEAPTQSPPSRSLNESNRSPSVDFSTNGRGPGTPPPHAPPPPRRGGGPLEATRIRLPAGGAPRLPLGKPSRRKAMLF